jgi:glycerophosphoryl diester phosphodiesterase
VSQAKGITGIDYHFKALQANPEWVKEAHDLGMTVNVWTVDDLDVARQMRDLKVDFITTTGPRRCVPWCQSKPVDRQPRKGRTGLLLL